jgi:RimJ/RimL family protein N-acetyltransferase
MGLPGRAATLAQDRVDTAPVAGTRVTLPPTRRLLLRRWQPGDLDSFAALNSDPEVMRHFPSTYDRSATAAMITAWEVKIDRQGFGLWAV